MDFQEASGGAGKLTKRQPQQNALRTVPCFPLETMMLALNTTRIDYWSLDVEGYELDILKTVPFDRLDIEILSVEYGHGADGKKPYVEFMAEKGYRVHKDIHMSRTEITLYVEDFIFVKN